jgi:hypothetical protein
MPIFVVLGALAALAYSAVRAFDGLSRHFGTGVAVGAAASAALVLAAALGYALQRRREVAPNISDGDWTHRLAADWGELRLAAGKRLCNVQLGGERGEYIFADLQGAEIEAVGSGWQLALKVRDARRAVWPLPMRDRRQARQWSRIIGLAMAQKL